MGIGAAAATRAFRKGLPRWGRALAALLFAVAMLTGLAHENSRYFYCEAMGLMATDPCAAAAEDASWEVHPFTEARQGHGDCCSVVTVPSLPGGTNAPEAAVPSAPLVAIIPAAELVGALLAAPVRGLPTVMIHGPAPPRTAAQARAVLMVFHT